MGQLPRLLLGTGFASLGEAETADVALIGHGLWRREFAGAGDVVGRAIRLNGRPHTILGVVPSHMRYPTADTQVFVPLRVAAPPQSDRAFHFLRVVGRLRAHRTLAQAEEQLRALAAHLAETCSGARSSSS